MTLPKRRSILQHFQQSPTVTALVMTLGTGAVGLNLTVASYVHILEPQWNPFIEKQAIGRVTRIGQEKPVTVVRYVAEHTIEQHIQTKQEKKMHFAQLGWEETTVSDETRFKKLIAMKSLLSYDSSVD
jgi:SNF2 family DNA or RNA helicase